MKTLPINQRDSWSLLPNGKPQVKAPAIASANDYEDMGSHFPNGKPKNEPTPNVFSADTFPKEGVIDAPEDSKAILDGYYTLIVFVTSGMILGSVLTIVTFFALYGAAIERGNLVSDTDDLIKQVQYNTEQIRDKVQKNADILPKINENIERLGSGIVNELKPKEAKIVNN